MTNIVASTGELEIDGQAPAQTARRSLIVRDSLTFLSLTLVTLTLFAVTLFLFRSFASHRTDLGRQWAEQGRVALEQGHPVQAIGALRTALTYTPGERSYELLLAQALEGAGHTEEAFNYFSGLWETQPGSGFVNLQLARLSAARKDTQQAINFYRASLYGTWEGDGVVRRRDVRLELARYLLAQHDVGAARAELLVAEGNAENNSALDMVLGSLFVQAGDRTHALEAYTKAADAAPANPAPLAAAGALAFHMGEFATAQRLLEQATRAESRPDRGGPPVTPVTPETSDLLRSSDRILELFPARKLTSEERVTRLLSLRTIARRRLETCAAAPAAASPALDRITQQWTEGAKPLTRSSLLRDPALQDTLLQLIFDTERAAASTCAPATGDDALLLLIAQDPRAVDR